MTKIGNAYKLTILFNPEYADDASIKAEIEESLEWMIVDHRAIRVSWDPMIGTGTWEDDDKGEGNGG